MRLGAQCTVARANAQPANNCLEPAISDGLLYEGGTESPFESLYSRKDVCMRIATIFMMIVLLNGTSAGTAGAADPSTDDQKTIYALGLIISQSLAPFSLTESELDFVEIRHDRRRPQEDPEGRASRPMGPRSIRFSKRGRQHRPTLRRKPGRHSSPRRRPSLAPRKPNPARS